MVYCRGIGREATARSFRLMKNLLPALFTSLLCILGSAHAQSGGWRDGNGQAVADNESMKSANDFAGSVLVTTDEDWLKKWNTPPDTKPNFNKAGTVPYGKKVFVLIFFANPKLDARGNANVRCDLKISSPNGKADVVKKGMDCYAGPIKGDPHNVYLSAPVVAFSGDANDPAGTWGVEVQLRDALRKVELPLRTSFELKQP